MWQNTNSVLSNITNSYENTRGFDGLEKKKPAEDFIEEETRNNYSEEEDMNKDQTKEFDPN